MACEKCKKTEKTASCAKSNPGGKICKSCCIESRGHSCKWWGMCWMSGVR